MKIEVTKRTLLGFAYSFVPDPLPAVPRITGTVRTLPGKIAEDVAWQSSRPLYRNRAYYVKHGGKWHRFSFVTGSPELDQMLEQGDPVANMRDMLYDVEHSYLYDSTGGCPVQTMPLYIELIEREQ